MQNLKALSLAALLGSGLAACGNGGARRRRQVFLALDTASPQEEQPIPEAVPVLRSDDAAARSVGLSQAHRFAVVSSGCAPESYNPTGTVATSGAIEFTTNGPKPPEGPCPGGTNVRYSGQVTASDSHRFISARGVTTVTCPDFGEHDFNT